MTLTVVIRNEEPMRYLDEPCTYRTVHIALTPEQVARLVLKDNEAISRAYLEPKSDD